MADHDRRGSDEILAPDFLADLNEKSIPELHRRRGLCQSEEDVLSYRRRVLQGRIDIAKAERARRSGSGEGGLIEALPGILADQVSQRREQTEARSSPVYVPDPGHSRRAEDADEAVLGRLPDLDDGELDVLIDRLEREERALSAQRREVLAGLDRLQDELMDRVTNNPEAMATLLENALADDDPADDDPAGDR